MGAFRPMDEYPPERLKDCWDDIPEDAKKWIKQTVVINHIDHDPSNNRVDNLEYVTQRENSRAAVKHYGGNVANKGKQRNDNEFIVFTEPKFNLLSNNLEQTTVDNKNYNKDVVEITDQELKLHKEFLKKELKKNFY